MPMPKTKRKPPKKTAKKIRKHDKLDVNQIAARVLRFATENK
jgi:hypothetical protein